MVFDVVLAAAILALLALLAARFDRLATRQASGVASINDGDSLTLAGERIRLVGIDAPEFDQTCGSGAAVYACGRKSRAALAALVDGGPVTCSGWEQDRYGRLLAICMAGDIELNRTMVETGWAIAYGDYEDAQAAARKRAAGLWAGEFDRPRDWRATHGAMAEAEHGLVGRIGNWLRALLGIGPA